MIVLISLRWQRLLLKKKASDYKFNKYKIDRKKLISEPKVTAESLKDEFEFAKKYISKPLYLTLLPEHLMRWIRTHLQRLSFIQRKDLSTVRRAQRKLQRE